MKSYDHLNYENRVRIETLKLEGYFYRRIAKSLIVITRLSVESLGVRIYQRLCTLLRCKNTQLYMITIQDFINVLSPIAQCYISKSIMQRNEKGEMEMVHAE